MTKAFGSMILAFIRWVRAILMWVQKKVRDSGINNKAADAAFCCCQCAFLYHDESIWIHDFGLYSLGTSYSHVGAKESP